MSTFKIGAYVKIKQSHYAELIGLIGVLSKPTFCGWDVQFLFELPKRYCETGTNNRGFASDKLELLGPCNSTVGIVKDTLTKKIFTLVDSSNKLYYCKLDNYKDLNKNDSIIINGFINNNKIIIISIIKV